MSPCGGIPCIIASGGRPCGGIASGGICSCGAGAGCGSGGGGYILGFTKDLEKAKIALKDYKLEVVYQF